ncbi:adenosylcobinamide-GDP ribazoletransferase [Rhizobium sp. L1K21]|nr:adenosylcobinamide-GDP ribazoletransferase [Rhizobium sp. L1K21]MCO6186244.1 adenosylcobinamide-GDP ribazoletransferase [Rhizobium sp. L1K21]
MSGYFGDIIRAMGFLSRIPMPSGFFGEGAFDLTRTVRAFPVAGFIISLPAAFAFWLFLMSDASPLLSAFVALAIQTLITGALHEDGLADTADGFWGGRDKQRILEIMHDSRSGAYGVAGLILSFGLRASALASLAEQVLAATATLIFLAAEMLSRLAMVVHWSLTVPARSDGVAASAGQPQNGAVALASFTGVILAFLLCIPVTGQVTTLLMIAAAFAAAYVFSGLTKGKIGGHTGDTLGACQQLAAIAVLLVAALLS